MADLLEHFQICSQDVWNSAKVAIGPFFCQRAQFCQTALDKVLIVSNFFHLRMLEATALRALQCSSFFLNLPQKGNTRGSSDHMVCLFLTPLTMGDPQSSGNFQKAKKP